MLRPPGGRRGGPVLRFARRGDASPEHRGRPRLPLLGNIWQVRALSPRSPEKEGNGMRLCSTILAPVLSIALVACGRSSPAAPAAEIEQLRVLAAGVVASTEAYVARAEAMADRAACRTARATYDAQVRPRIEGMVGPRAQGGPVAAGQGPGRARRHRVRGRHHARRARTAPGHRLQLSRPGGEQGRGGEAPRGHGFDGRTSRSRAPRQSAAAMAPGAEEREEGGPRCVRFSDGTEMYLP